MAITILTDASVIINSVDLSDHVRRVGVSDVREKKDITAMGALSRVYGKGLGDATANIEFFQDFAAGEVYATLQPLIASGTGVPISIKPTSGAKSATNPAAEMSGLIFDFTFIEGEVGEPSMLTVEITNASQAGITYDITP